MGFKNNCLYKCLFLWYLYFFSPEFVLKYILRLLFCKKSFATLAAWIRFLSIVCYHVVFKNVLHCETLCHIGFIYMAYPQNVFLMLCKSTIYSYGEIVWGFKNNLLWKCLIIIIIITLHLYGFSPECVLKRIISPTAVSNDMKEGN